MNNKNIEFHLISNQDLMTLKIFIRGYSEETNEQMDILRLIEDIRNGETLSLEELKQI